MLLTLLERVRNTTLCKPFVRLWDCMNIHIGNEPLSRISKVSRRMELDKSLTDSCRLKLIFCRCDAVRGRVAGRKVKRFNGRMVICNKNDDKTCLVTFVPFLEFTIVSLIIMIPAQKSLGHSPLK